MNLKKIAQNSVKRWYEKNRSDSSRKESPTNRISPKSSLQNRTSLREASTRTSAGARLNELLDAFLAEHCEFRYNLLTEITEIRYKDKENADGFHPLTERELNMLCIEAQSRGIACWDRELHRMANSSHIKEYHPFRLYFQNLPAWDGIDRLGLLAERVSKDALWVRSFHRWMLGLAAQWSGISDGKHALSVAPLLVSTAQGMGKSTFCRSLIPSQLQAYYTDNVDLSAPEKVERMLTEMGLINLDEFDRIAPKRHPLLKNLMQLCHLNIRKTYRRHTSLLPRIAAFIGTSNSRELLCDPTGSRRFICVSVEHPIDCREIDHAQIFAQLKAELERGERYWFNAEEEKELCLHNAAFYRVTPAQEVLNRLFRVPLPEEEGVLLSLPEMLGRLKKKLPGVMSGINLLNLSQAATAVGIQKIHTYYGNRYRVVEIL